MSALYFDLCCGISGDMAVAALLSLAGQVEREGKELSERLRTLPLSGYEIEVKRERRKGLEGTLFTVHTGNRREKPRDYSNIRTLLGGSGLPEDEKMLALAIFETLAQAEASVHGVPQEKVHFHELGAVDSIVDIVCFSILYTKLRAGETHASPVSLGSGITASMHGEIPLPAPATLEILRGLPVRGTVKPFELTTPTGAAILRTVVKQFGPLPPGRIRALGLGFGHRENGSFNGLRILSFDPSFEQEDADMDRIAVIEVTIDDSTPEEIGFLQEILLSGGAKDAWVAPVQMKKNRPGFNLTVLCDPGELDHFARVLLHHCSSFGLRYSLQDRMCLERRVQEVSTAYGPIAVKIGMLGGAVLKAVPEYEDCRAAALKHGVPLRLVFETARTEAARQLGIETPGHPE
jgi:uncharacterized protein (TIGR00299 family) protein